MNSGNDSLVGSMKVSNWLSASAVAHPERPALVCGDQQLTYAELDRRVTETSRRLAGLELDAGNRVATTLSAGVELVVLAHAAMRVGVVLAPIDPGLRPAERDALIASLDPTVVIDDVEYLDDAPLGPERDGDALELERVLSVIHTSGSGGPPKPVELTVANHLWSAVGCGMRIGMSPEDRWLCCLPMHHIGGFAIPIRCAIYGATVLVEPFEADRTADTLAAGTTLVSLVATMLDRLLDRGQGLGELRCALLGGGPAPTALIERAIEAGAPLAPTYGMTEACSQVTTLLPEELLGHRGSSGRPIPSTRLRIDEDGRILVAGPTVAPGESGDGGWLRTGDLGRLDPDGYLHVLGRADQTIVTGGENVSPEEVEQVIATHPDVADVAVFSRDDERWQQAVVAAVITREGRALNAEGLRSFCRERLVGYKVPKKFDFVTELPRNAEGKLLRRELS